MKSAALHRRTFFSLAAFAVFTACFAVDARAGLIVAGPDSSARAGTVGDSREPDSEPFNRPGDLEPLDGLVFDFGQSGGAGAAGSSATQGGVYAIVSIASELPDLASTGRLLPCGSLVFPSPPPSGLLKPPRVA